MHMMPALLEMMARAGPAVDPQLLTDHAKNARIMTLQARVTELEEIAEFLATLILSVERETIGAGADDRAYRKRILALCGEIKCCVIPMNRTERVTGAETFVGRSLYDGR